VKQDNDTIVIVSLISLQLTSILFNNVHTLMVFSEIITSAHTYLFN
jgi:hypothetical protein